MLSRRYDYHISIGKYVFYTLVIKEEICKASLLYRQNQNNVCWSVGGSVLTVGETGEVVFLFDFL